MIDKNRLPDEPRTATRVEPTTIECPSCGSDVQITEALARGLREQIEGEYQARERQRAQEYKQKDDALRSARADLDAQAAALAEREAEATAEVERKVALRLSTERAKAEQAAAEKVAGELAQMRAELEGAKADADAAKKKELEVLKLKADLEKAQADLELTVARTLEAERTRLRSEAKAESDEENRLRIAQKDTVIESMKAQLEEARRKAEQGSQQAQGEALELTLEDLLRAEFPYDVFEPVPKGITGADLVQRVRTEGGLECGTILWEAKRTKNWSPSWLPKLRDDQRELKAEIAVLISIALPKDAGPIQQIEGVWVANFASVLGVAYALRHGLVEAASAKQALVGRSDKVELLYAYFAGPEFRARIEGLLEPFLQMRQDLDKEKRAVTRLWAKREKQIARALTSLMGMYGDLQGIAGATIPELEALDLPALEDGEDESPES